MNNPTTLVEQFNGSIGAFIGVDPIRFDDGLWIEEGATNLCANPNFETSTAATMAWNTATVSQSSEQAYVGSYSLKVVASQNGGRQVQTPSGQNTTGGDYAIRGQVWVPAGKVGRCKGYVLYTDGSEEQLGAEQVVTGNDDWQGVELTITPNAGKTVNNIRFLSYTTNTGGATYFLDAIQIEYRSYATSYADGSLGDGYAWTSTAHASTSTRAASSASISPAGILAPGSGAVAFRVTPTIETGLEELWGECGVKGAGTDHLRWGRDSTKHPFVEWSANDAAYQRLTASETVDAGTAYDLYLGHDGTDVSLSVDAGTANTGTRASVSDSFGAGDLTLEASAGGVIYDEFATFDRTLTNYEVARLNAAPAWSLVTLAANTQTRRIRQQFQLRPY